jgi:hypothetical protein
MVYNYLKYSDNAKKSEDAVMILRSALEIKVEKAKERSTAIALENEDAKLDNMILKAIDELDITSESKKTILKKFKNKWIKFQDELSPLIQKLNLERASLETAFSFYQDTEPSLYEKGVLGVLEIKDAISKKESAGGGMMNMQEFRDAKRSTIKESLKKINDYCNEYDEIKSKLTAQFLETLGKIKSGPSSTNAPTSTNSISANENDLGDKKLNRSRSKRQRRSLSLTQASPSDGEGFDLSTTSTTSISSKPTSISHSKTSSDSSIKSREKHLPRQKSLSFTLFNTSKIKPSTATEALEQKPIDKIKTDKADIDKSGMDKAEMNKAGANKTSAEAIEEKNQRRKTLTQARADLKINKSFASSDLDSHKTDTAESRSTNEERDERDERDEKKSKSPKNQ